jgi:hypothetical protein
MKHRMDFMEFISLNQKATIIIYLLIVNVPCLTIQFFQRSCYFDNLSNLVSNLEVGLCVTMFINIFLVLPLHLFEIKHELCLNVHPS